MTTALFITDSAFRILFSEKQHFQQLINA